MNRLAIEGEAQSVDGVFQLGRLGARIGLAEVPQEHAELVTAEPPDHVRGPHDFAEHTGHRLQDFVARGMSKRIVDRLEVIDVEHNQRASCVIALDEGDGAVKLPRKSSPIEDVEQNIALGQSRQFSDPGLRRGEFRLEAAYDLARPRRGRRRTRPGAAHGLPTVFCSARSGIRGLDHALLFHRRP